jgi:gamma-glutamyltranspeptidase/glutathione hydrolase
MTVGAAGGPTIITQVVQALVRRIDLGLPLADAIGQRRIHHQWSPDELRIEAKLDERLRQSLQARGHTLKETRNMGVTQAIIFDPGGHKQFLGVFDPRIPGQAAGP